MRDLDLIAAARKLDRHTRRLLRDLTGLGEMQAERIPARERLESQLGDALCRSLLDVDPAATRERADPTRAA